MLNIKKILIHLAIFLIKLLIILKTIAFVVITAILKIIKFFLCFVFYKIIIKGYCGYLFILKKLGWTDIRTNIKGRFISFLLSKKLVHCIVIAITCIIIFTNLTPKTQINLITDKAQNAILANLIKNEFENIEQEKLIEEFFDAKNNFLTIRQTYLDNIDVIKSQPKAALQEKIQDIISITQEGLVTTKPNITLTEKSKKPRTKIIDYTVILGDTVSTIAEKYEVSVNTILWENNLSAYSLIRPGDKLVILPVSGITHTIKKGETISTIAQKYKIEEEKIQEFNKLTSSNKLSVNQKLIIPGGEKIQYSRVTIARQTGLSVIKNLVKPENTKPKPGNKMYWPTVGYRITQYYSWRHKAIDIANKTGTPIYAADTGTVEYSGWNMGYGLNIIINHGGGKKTRYGHCSKIYVKKEEKVKKGEVIAVMGSTGWSTGPHIHFEVIIHGNKENPLNYIR